ncbi:MAG: hypothetical protein H6555_02800 [Lewinellaceae bacterium]|nr:hypothetical protein [Lewinellaceae bacterium]
MARSNFFIRLLNRLPKYALWLTGAWVIITNTILFPFFGAKMDPAGQQTPLDLQVGFSKAVAEETLAAYGAQGREVYFLTELTVDLIYPIMYAVFFGLLLLRAAKRAQVAPTGFAYQLIALPFVAALGDFIENAALVTMVQQFPILGNTAVLVANAGQLLKWAAIIVSVLCLLSWWVVGWQKRQRQA